MRIPLFAALFIAGCTAPSTGVPLVQDFELAPGQTVAIGGTGQTVTFEAVPEDSRCPAGVMCVWAGNARVSLRLGGAVRDTTISLNTGVEPHALSVGSIKLELRAVTPGPVAGTKTPADSYRVTLRASGS